MTPTATRLRPEDGRTLHTPAQTSVNTIATLLRRVAAGDHRAFSALYQATSAKLYGIILRILRRRDLADEVLQEVYVKIWERAALYDAAKGSPITWMATIARNRAIDEIRSKRPLPTEDVREALNIAGDEEDPLERVHRSEELQRVLKCLDRLEPQRREIVLLAYRDGMSREALGQRYSRPAATIKSWLHRSLAQLRECLDQ
jgi:RNA polymerase sigma-70 factor (ECF subfamily)